MGVRPPGPSPGDAVSIKSSQDKRPKRSPGETRDQEGTAISARSEARTNDLEVRQAAATIGNEESHQSTQENGGRLWVDKHKSIVMRAPNTNDNAELTIAATVNGIRSGA